MLRIIDNFGGHHVKDWRRYSYSYEIGKGLAFVMEFDDGDHITVSRHEYVAQMLRIAQCRHWEAR